jgi:hypothetical protein
MSQKNSVGRPCLRKFPSAKSQDGPPHCLKERFFEIFENFVRRRREFARHKAKQEPGSIQEGDPSSDSASERPPWRALLRSLRKLPLDNIEQFQILPALGVLPQNDRVPKTTKSIFPQYLLLQWY